MTLETLRLLFDFGLTVLVWLVQLLVYPSFEQYSKTNLIRWHRFYMGRIACIVIPLMLGQLIISGWQVFQEPSVYSVVSILAILFLWLFTFIHFVPLHGQISEGNFTNSTLRTLVARNWVRTITWSLLFVYGITELYYK